MLWSRMCMMTMLLHVCVLLGVANASTMLDTRALIEQALDESTAITLEDVKLGDAIEIITEQSGVKILMPPEVMGLVPHGAETLIQRVQIANMSLRQGLTELFSPLGMTFAVGDSYVEIVPKEALLCLGRPPTWTELDVLAELSAIQPGIDNDALAALRPRIQFQMAVPAAWTLLSEAIRSVGAGPGDEVLTIACANLGWVWRLSDQRIVLVPMERQIQRQLQQPISLRIDDTTLIDVLQALAERVNVDIRSEPGALASLPIYMQRGFSVNVHQQSAEEVLDKIAAHTGLGYLIEPDGVLFYKVGNGSGRNLAGDAPPASVSLSDPYVAKVVVPLGGGKSIEWLVRQSELPEDLQRMRQNDLAETFEAVRRHTTEGQP